jgi:hypothetical protein
MPPEPPLPPPLLPLPEKMGALESSDPKAPLEPPAPLPPALPAEPEVEPELGEPPPG